MPSARRSSLCAEGVGELSVGAPAVAAAEAPARAGRRDPRPPGGLAGLHASLTSALSQASGWEPERQRFRAAHHARAAARAVRRRATRSGRRVAAAGDAAAPLHARVDRPLPLAGSAAGGSDLRSAGELHARSAQPLSGGAQRVFGFAARFAAVLRRTRSRRSPSAWHARRRAGVAAGELASHCASLEPLVDRLAGHADELRSVLRHGPSSSRVRRSVRCRLRMRTTSSPTCAGSPPSSQLAGGLLAGGAGRGSRLRRSRAEAVRGGAPLRADGGVPAAARGTWHMAAGVRLGCARARAAACRGHVRRPAGGAVRLASARGGDRAQAAARPATRRARGRRAGGGAGVGRRRVNGSLGAVVDLHLSSSPPARTRACASLLDEVPARVAAGAAPHAGRAELGPMRTDCSVRGGLYIAFSISNGGARPCP